MPVYEVELRGFDPKEDGVDGTTSRTVLVETKKTTDKGVIADACKKLPFKKCGVFWNKKLSKVNKKVKVL